MRGYEEKLHVFERKTLIKMYGNMFKNIEQKWKIKTNTQIYQLYKRDDVVQFIKRTKIEWADHICRANGSTLKEAMIDVM